MDMTNMTPTERAAWHRSEADRIESEERARRPALAAGQAWEKDGIAGIIGRDSNEQFYLTRTDGLVVWLGKNDPGLNPKWTYLGLARDVLRVVPPDPPAPQVAPEPTGAELVGRRCWVRSRDTDWIGPFLIEKVDIMPRVDRLCYCVENVDTTRQWWEEAKPYVEGVAP